MTKKIANLRDALLRHMRDNKKEHPRKEKIVAEIKKEIKKSKKKCHVDRCKSQNLRLQIDYKNLRIFIICNVCNGQEDL